MNAKQRAAESAVQLIQNGMVVGLGTGSTAEIFIKALADAVRAGRLDDIRGVPTSIRSEELAQQSGIPLTTLAHTPRIDITVDGADEVTPDLNLIKGLGGALLREKMIAQNSVKLVIIVDSTKCVDVLGTKSPLPVEVVPFSHEAQERYLKTLGATPTLRMSGDKAFVTDNGNYIYDCRFSSIPNPHDLEQALFRRAGIVESGLFLGLATLAIVGDDSGVRTVTRSRRG